MEIDTKSHTTELDTRGGAGRKQGKYIPNHDTMGHGVGP